MIVSLFSLFVARGAELPVTDHRLVTQPASRRVNTQDQGPAAQEATISEDPGTSTSPTENAAPEGGV